MKRWTTCKSNIRKCLHHRMWRKLFLTCFNHALFPYETKKISNWIGVTGFYFNNKNKDIQDSKVHNHGKTALKETLEITKSRVVFLTHFFSITPQEEFLGIVFHIAPNFNIIDLFISVYVFYVYLHFIHKKRRNSFPLTIFYPLWAKSPLSWIYFSVKEIWPKKS